MNKRYQKILLVLIILIYLVISGLTSYAYDDAFYFQYFKWVYLYSVQPYYLWIFGAFYNAINIASLFINLPFYILGLDNVIVQQFTIKLPFVVASIIVGFVLVRILKLLRPGLKIGNLPLLLFLLLPITIFDVALFGNPLIISIMFLMVSVFLFVVSRPRVSSIFLALSASTYFYPMFFILPLTLLVYKRYGKVEAFFSFFLFLLVLAIGQLLPLLVSIATGTPLHLTILAPFIGSFSSLTVTSIFPSMWGPYFIVYTLFHFSISNLVEEWAFLFFMIIPMFIFLYKKESANLEGYISFIFLESGMFIIFSPTETPQYLLAIAPMILLLYYLKNSVFYVVVFTIISLFDILIFFTKTPLLYFYSNINPTFAYIYRLGGIPYWTQVLLSSLYLVTLCMLYIYHIAHDRIRLEKYKGIYLIFRKFLCNAKFYSPEKMIKRGVSLLIILLIISLFVSAPQLSKVPRCMYFTPQASSESSRSVLYHTSNNQDSYYVNLSGSYHLLNRYTMKNGKYVLCIPPTTINRNDIKNVPNQGKVVSSDNLSLSITASANPAIVGQQVIFYSTIIGGAGPFTYSWFGGGNAKSINETSIFSYPGNYSVGLVVKDSNGVQVTAQYNETILNDYKVYFNSHFLGGFISLSPHQIPINQSFIRNNNFLNISGNFQSNVTINLNLNMPSFIPTNEILENSMYLLIGVFFSIISVAGLVYTIRIIKK